MTSASAQNGCDFDSIVENYQSSQMISTLCEDYGNSPTTLTVFNGTSSQYPSGWNNEVIFVSGLFVVNTPSFSIDNCIIKFAPGAGILVMQSNELQVDRSRLFSCENMWKGIESGLATRIIVSNSHIEDAQYAINAKGAKFVFSNNTIYDGNWVAIRLHHKTPNSAAINTFRGNQFRGNHLLKSPFINQTPTPGNRALVGIWASSIPSLVIGHNALENRNTFTALNIGVLTNASTAYVTNSIFYAMINQGIIEGYQTVIGISALNNSYILQTGLGKNGLATFSGCQFASIHTERSTCYTQRSKYERIGKFGVHAINPFDHFMRVTDNRFENTNVGFLTNSAVFIERSMIGDDRINDNYVYSNKEAGASFITISDVVDGSGQAEILRDTILDVSESSNLGIELRPGDGINFRVSNNDLTFNHLWTGITVYHSGGANPAMPTNCVVSENKVQAINTAFRLAWLFNSQNVTFCNNELLGNSTGAIGFTAQLNCSGSVIGQNLFDDMLLGLRFTGTGINMGTQNHHGNRWKNGFTLAAQHTGADYPLSKFNINSDSNNCGDANYLPNDNGPVSIDPTSGWFFDQSLICVNECTDLYDELMLKPVYKATISGLGQEMGWSPAAQWAANDFLYRTTQMPVNTGLTSSELNTFDDQITATAIPALVEKKKTIKRALSGTAEEIATIRNGYEEYFHALENHIESLQIWLDNDMVEELDMMNWVESSESFNNTLEHRDGRRAEHLATEGDWSTLNVVSFIEEQLKAIEQIKLKRLSAIELSSADWAIVEHLAVQCYDQYGPAVFKAQALLPNCRWKELHLLAEAACEYQGLQNLSDRSNTVFVNEKDIRIAPNPSAAEVKVQFNEEVLPNDQLFILDIYGRAVLQQAAEQKQIDVSNLPAGIYLLQWRRENTILATEKLLRS